MRPGLEQPVEKPGALQLAIRAWQRQLVEMADAVKRQADDSVQLMLIGLDDAA
jgi:hypothetical protein